MTSVRWARAEAEQAAAEAVNARWFPADGIAVAAVLDALGLTDRFTVTDGHLEQVGWHKPDGPVIDAADSAEMQLVEMAPDEYAPVYRVVPS